MQIVPQMRVSGKLAAHTGVQDTLARPQAKHCERSENVACFNLSVIE